MTTKVTKDGYVQHTDDRSYRQHEHVRAAERKLGRRLGKKEAVHHQDENKQNNDPDNLMVMRSAADHARLHSRIPVEIFQTADGSHVVVKQQRECPECRRLFEPDNNRNVHCSLLCAASSQTKHIPTAEELRKLVWSRPTTHIATKFGVSDVAVAKWCDKLGVEKPPRGYWAKLKAGRV